MRKTIKTEIATLDVGYTTLRAISENVCNLIDQFGADCIVEREVYPYSDDTYLAVYKDIPETDEQMAKRVALEEQQALRISAQERATYKRLKKKFEKIELSK